MRQSNRLAQIRRPSSQTQADFTSATLTPPASAASDDLPAGKETIASSSPSLGSPANKTLASKGTTAASDGGHKRPRGRPRKTADQITTSKQSERRRGQLREAQRAWRDRRNAMASQVEHRATQSAAALGKMNSLIHIFGEDLAQSGLLSDRPGLESHLRHVLAACQSLVEQQHPHLAADECVSQQRMSTGSASSPPSDATRVEPPSRPIPALQPDRALQSVPALRTMLQPQLSSAALSTINLDEFPMPLGPRSPLLFDDLEEDAAVDVSVFARHVRRACCYHAYFALRDPSISYADLRPKFRFLFSMHTRDTLIAYYHEAAVYADSEPARMDRWQGIPFLDVGGAGSHYATKQPGASPSSSRLGYSSSNASIDSFGNASQQRDEPEANGKESDRVSHAWFDIHDLEGYLLEKQIKLVANPTTERQASASTERPIFNPSKLIRMLVGTCTCLGRSPGWRVANIDNCLEQALVAT